MGNLDAPPTRQVAVVVELLFQFQDLMACVGGALAFWLHSRLVRPVCCTGKDVSELWSVKTQININALYLLGLNGYLKRLSTRLPQCCKPLSFSKKVKYFRRVYLAEDAGFS